MAHVHHAGSIDIHAHYFPEAFLRLIGDSAAAYGIEWKMQDGGPQFRIGHVTTGPVGKRFVDLDTRLAAMDEQKLEAHAMSLSQPLTYWAKPDLAQKLTEVYNDGLAAAHEKHPTRLFGLATLPMHVPELAVREVERAAKLPGMKGYYIATQVNGKDLSDASFFPVYERIEATGLPLFLHPVNVLAPERLTQYYLTNLLGNPFESGVAAAHLIFGGVLDRFEKLTVVLPHAGGAFPWLVWRLNRGWQKRQDLKHIKHGPAEYLRRFYYDTVGYSDHVIDYLARVVGIDRILMGSDYCFPIAYEQPVDIVADHPTLDGAAKEAIISGNARALLRI
jgi:aminocarboxymuconate-semialdehyde decarboxylase